MDEIAKIKSSNEELGIETIFYSAENDVLGYSEGNKIFLNTYYLNDIGMTNKHELLHFYRNSKQFKLIQHILFSVMSEDDIKKIRDQYYVKYMSLYSEKQIEEGILDEEITIDMIINNGEFPIRVDNYIKNAYEFVINNRNNITLSTETRRYLNITLSRKIEQQFPKLTKWEKLFVLNYYNGKDRILPTNKTTKYDDIRRTIKEELEKLYKYAEKYGNFIVNYSSEELKRKIDLEIDALMEYGDAEGAEFLQQNYIATLASRANMISNNLQREYKKIIEVLISRDYEDAFKYLMLNETINKIYKKEKIGDRLISIVSKRNSSESISSHMVLSLDVLDMIYNNIDEYDNFSKLYFASLDVFNEKVKRENSIQLENIDTFEMGRWIKFESKKNNEKEFISNAQKLAVLVKDTIWCTKTQASSHLEKGDYYVFVDHDGKPHIAIRMIGNEINEVRGIENGNAQEIEADYRKVAMEFLEKNVNIRHGREWLEKESWNKRLLGYIKKIETNSLLEEDIDNLIYDITEVNDYKIHFVRNRNKLKLLEMIKEIPPVQEKLAEKYGCKIDEIYFGSISLFDDFGDVFPYAVVLGSIAFNDNSKKADYSKLRYAFGNVYFDNSTVEELPNLEVIGGDVNLNKSAIKDLPKLRRVGGKVSLNGRCNLQSLDSLEFIEGDAFFYETNEISFKNLRYIGGNANFTKSEVNRLESLEIVKGSLTIHDSMICDLSSLEYVGNNADFSDSKLERLNPNCNIIGKINFYNCPLEEQRVKNR